MNCILAFERRRQTNFLRRANIGSRFRSKHLSHRYMEHKKKRCILAKDSTASLKGLESCNMILVWLDSLVFQGVSKQMISSKATDVLSFTIFKWSVITSSLIKTTIRPFLNTTPKDAIPPPKKNQKQSKIKFSRYLTWDIFE